MAILVVVACTRKRPMHNRACMSFLEDPEEPFRVRASVQQSAARPRRRGDLGTSENPIVLCPSPVQPALAGDLSVGRTQSVSRMTRRKCPLGAYVEIIENPRPVRSSSVESCNMAVENTVSSHCPQTAPELATHPSGDSSQPTHSGNANVKSSHSEGSSVNQVYNNQCLCVPENFEILMRCSICMEIFHNPANVSPCNHKFCYSCLLSWKRCSQTAVCPQCRGPIQGMHKDAQFNEIVESFLLTNPAKRRSSSELEALDATEADFIQWQNRGHSRTRRRGTTPQTRSRTSADRAIRTPLVIRVSNIRAHRAPLTNRQRGQQGILEDWFTV